MKPLLPIALGAALVCAIVLGCPTQPAKIPTLPDGAAITVAGACTHLLQFGCGHDQGACVAGLGNEIDAGYQTVDLACAQSAPDLDAAIHCPGVGACPP